MRPMTGASIVYIASFLPRLHKPYTNPLTHFFDWRLTSRLKKAFLFSISRCQF